MEEDELLRQPILQHLNIMRKQFPYSLDVSVLVVNMAWEYALAWQRELNSFKYLEAMLKCFNHIPNVNLKQGLYNLVWNTHLKIVFESASKLINKVGKLPKEKLCKQDTGLSDAQICIFFEMCTKFFDDFMGAVSCCYNTEKVYYFVLLLFLSVYRKTHSDDIS